MQEDTVTLATAEVVNKFNTAFNQHDVQSVMALMTDDCIFENTFPAPDGERFEGQKAVRHFWEEFFQASPQAIFQTEEMITCGDRCIVRWRYEWRNAENQNGHIRGIDVFRVQDGKVSEKLSYVKG